MSTAETNPEQQEESTQSDIDTILMDPKYRKLKEILAAGCIETIKEQGDVIPTIYILIRAVGKIMALIDQQRDEVIQAILMDILIIFEEERKDFVLHLFTQTLSKEVPNA